jgi:hypothetical protein
MVFFHSLREAVVREVCSDECAVGIVCGALGWRSIIRAE